MGVIEEGRQLPQDLAIRPQMDRTGTPLPNALEEKIAAFEARTGKRFDRVDKLETRIDRNHGQVLEAIRWMERDYQLAGRIARLESKMQNGA